MSDAPSNEKIKDLLLSAAAGIFGEDKIDLDHLVAAELGLPITSLPTQAQYNPSGIFGQQVTIPFRPTRPAGKFGTYRVGNNLANFIFKERSESQEVSETSEEGCILSTKGHEGAFNYRVATLGTSDAIIYRDHRCRYPSELLEKYFKHIKETEQKVRNSNVNMVV